MSLRKKTWLPLVSAALLLASCGTEKKPASSQPDTPKPGSSIDSGTSQSAPVTEASSASSATSEAPITSVEVSLGEIDSRITLRLSTTKCAPGDTVKVTCYYNALRVNFRGILVNGSSNGVSQSGSDYVFTAPYAAKAVVTADADVIYHALSEEHEEAAHLQSIGFYAKAGDGSYAPIQQAAYLDEVYIKAAFESPYGVDSIKVTSLDSLSTSTIVAQLQSDGYYLFKMPNEDARAHVYEKNLSAYAGMEFVGDYTGFEISFTNDNYDVLPSSTSPYRGPSIASIDAAGDVTTYSSNVTARVSSADTENHSFLLDSVYTVHYDGKLLFAHADASGFSTFTYAPDDIVVSAKIAEGKTAKNYAFRAERFLKASGEKGSYAAVEVYESGALYDTLWVDSNGSEEKFYFGVTFEKIAGDYVSSDAAEYIVKDAEGNFLAHPTVKEGTTGGASHRIMAGAEYGTYTAADGTTLTLNGQSTATMSGVEGSLFYLVGSDGTSITVDSSTTEYSITLDKEAMSFTITATTDLSTVVPAFIGNAYRGTLSETESDDDYSDSSSDTDDGTWDDAAALTLSDLIPTRRAVEGSYLYLYFQDSTTLISFVSSSKTATKDDKPWLMWMNGSTSAYSLGSSTYSYDPATHTVSATIVDCQNTSGASVRFTYNASTDSFTGVSGYGSNSNYQVAGKAISRIS